MYFFLLHAGKFKEASNCLQNILNNYIDVKNRPAAAHSTEIEKLKKLESLMSEPIKFRPEGIGEEYFRPDDIMGIRKDKISEINSRFNDLARGVINKIEKKNN